jgi:hypothetical protein
MTSTGHALHVDLTQGHAENLSQENTRIVNGLGRRPDGEPPIPLRKTHRRFGLHLVVINATCFEFPFQDDLCLFKAFLDVTFLNDAVNGYVILYLEFFISK